MPSIRSIRIPLVILALIVAAGGAYYWQNQRANSSREKYKTQVVDRGDIVQSISANGTLSPVVLVNVGTQVSGTVKKLNADFNSRVKEGQILAELDPALFDAQLRQDQANIANAEANLVLMRAKEERARLLQQKGFISQDAVDQARQQLDSALAQLKLAQAQLTRSRTNLNYSVIRSPISGVVVARNIDVGQTVAASFQTPVLFQIAGDLKQMQIETSVAEADIGNLNIGLDVRFTVDAFADRQFSGKVKQVRLNPTVQQNVVTYNVVVAVDNPDEVLLPGMTAHVQIIVSRHENVLRVSNAALRFKPLKEEGDEVAGKNNKKIKGRGGATVYRLDQGAPKPVKIKAGISDGSYTEVLGDELKLGESLVVREMGAKKDKGSGFSLRMM
ncbi:RND family efflux transporter MFP subunit [Sulfuricella denitrificans skB26]|uniref:RND family efflux transporter MFP subunit n=1 Tax=Sulfuricella denitrificans (strain DSM 22764 / NBRC 105220 / skB26) TaxID=1163617 RepID=S6AAT1_SULDS|nr:efflux RND transporter periplasmic adaptor subunit [Sulfuricella denitrificans]BAN36215.1 RND family efflux transporter MFP subunit [Sulfuricella denitrificans skB26]